MNLGPQHPSAHGVLRIIVELVGEKIVDCDPHIGLLHRGTEKLLENKKVLQNIGYFDRLDYVSTLSQEHTYCLSIEKLINEEMLYENEEVLVIPERAQQIRVLLLEITRILNHLLALTTHAMDLGAITPFLWHFEEREKLLSLCEQLSGARMHTYFMRPGGVYSDIPAKWLDQTHTILNSFYPKVIEAYDMLKYNRIFQSRTKDIGIVTEQMIKFLGFSGVMARGSGIPYDLRRDKPYESYFNSKLPIIIGRNGDCYDRFLVRAGEIKASVDLIKDIINGMPGLYKGPLRNSLFETNRQVVKRNMEDLINHFKQFSEGIILPKESTYISTEVPKGELGVFSLTNPIVPTNHFRCHIRSPGFYHLAGMRYITKGSLLADLVAIIGTLDLVFGEVDR